MIAVALTVTREKNFILHWDYNFYYVRLWGVLSVKLFANQSAIVATSPKFEYQIDSLPRNYKGRQKMYGIVLHCQNFLSSSPSQQQQLFKWKQEIDRQYKPRRRAGALRDKYNIAPGFLFTSNTLLGVENVTGENWKSWEVDFFSSFSKCVRVRTGDITVLHYIC